MVGRLRNGVAKVRKMPAGEFAFQFANYTFFIFVGLITLYPFLHVVVKSLIAYRVDLAGIKHYYVDLGAYAHILTDERIIRSFFLTIFVVLVSSVLHVAITMLAAYPLSKRELRGRTPILLYILLTMLFSGGLVPFYILIRELGLRNSVLVYIVIGVVSGFNIIICKNFLQSVPQSLDESARIDGASHFGVLFRIYVPLSKPIMATIALWFAVGKWNDWFTGLLYISNQRLYLLQNVLQQMLILNQGMNDAMGFGSQSSDLLRMADSVKMAVIVVATMPIVMVYPFVQKYFIKGVLLGSVKE